MLHVLGFALLFWLLELGVNLAVSVFNFIGKALGPAGFVILIAISILSVVSKFYVYFLKTAAAIGYYDSAKQTAV